MLLQTVPAVDRDSVVPPGSELWEPRVLRIKLEHGNLLEGVFLLVPLDANVLDRLLLEVLQHLSTEAVGDLVLHVEVAGVLRDAVDWVRVFDVEVLDVLLSLTQREHGILGDVVTVSVRRLRVLGACHHYTWSVHTRADCS